MEETNIPSMLSVIATVVVLTVCSSVGQSTFSSSVGVVQDKTDAVVPCPTVERKDLADHSTRSATAHQDGSFEFVNLKPSRYEASVDAADSRTSECELLGLAP